jgi:hypothetical protein
VFVPGFRNLDACVLLLCLLADFFGVYVAEASPSNASTPLAFVNVSVEGGGKVEGEIEDPDSTSLFLLCNRVYSLLTPPPRCPCSFPNDRRLRSATRRSA